MKRWRVLAMAGLIGLGTAQAESLDGVLEAIDPDVPKWMSLVVVEGDEETPRFEWYHYRDSRDSVAFWPASTIKIYSAVHAVEKLNGLGMPFDSVLMYERYEDGQWKLDCARSMKEMISEVFRRSSNEDYTLHLRFCGIDGINTRFLVPERGFPHSALMRGYVTGRPYAYDLDAAQRITVIGADGQRKVVEHTWSGHSYAKDRGATVISDTTGNCTSTAELAESMRRLVFHRAIAEEERYRITDEQARFIVEGADGFHGMLSDEGLAWDDAIDQVFPEARYYRKGGTISTHHLDVVYIDDEASGARFVLAIATESDKPDTLKKMATATAEWVRARMGEETAADPMPGP